MNTHVIKREINGIELSFTDIQHSLTVQSVFNELNNDCYGLEQISLSKNDTIIDVGANVGMFSIYAKKKFGCKIISFEPVPENYNNFLFNIELNGLSLDDFELHNTAITNIENGTIVIGTPLTNTGGSSVYHVGNISNTCNTETLSKYITDDCKYIKIDCEGGEYDIIPAILNDLKNVKYIGIEYHKFNNDQDPHKLHDTLISIFNGEIYGSPSNFAYSY